MADGRLTALAQFLEQFPKASVPDQHFPAVFIQHIQQPGLKTQYVLLDYDMLGVLVKNPSNQELSFIRWSSILELTRN